MKNKDCSNKKKRCAYIREEAGKQKGDEKQRLETSNKEGEKEIPN